MSTTHPEMRPRRRRARRSAAEWSQLVEEWSRSGLSAEAFVASRDLPRSSFHWWRVRLKGPIRSGSVKAHAPVRLVPVQLSDARHSETSPSTEVDPIPQEVSWQLTNAQGHVLRVQGPLARETLHAALAVLTSQPSGMQTA
jgi:hypothetical protein